MKLILLAVICLASVSCKTFDGRVDAYYKTPDGNTYGGSYELKNRSGFAK